MNGGLTPSLLCEGNHLPCLDAAIQQRLLQGLQAGWLLLSGVADRDFLRVEGTGLVA